MSELDKLELYLITAGYKHYERIDEEHLFVSRHQIIIYDENGERLWDAICHRGSYGYENGLFWERTLRRILKTMSDGHAKNSWSYGRNGRRY